MSTIQERLVSFRGAGAEIWSYTTSHSKLVLRLRHESAGILNIVMEDVYGIWGPVAWPDSQLSVTKDEASKEYIVRDSCAGFLVTCGLVLATDPDDE